jgi:pimeloyl-ACP methyl ester carboxylesterase
MKARVDGLVAEANVHPFSIVHGGRLTVITGYEVHSAFRKPLYSAESFPELAQTLKNAIDGNFSLLLQTLDKQLPQLDDTCVSPNSSVLAMKASRDAQISILCGDGEDARGLGLTDIGAYVAELVRQSPTLGPLWSRIRFECTGWEFRPRWRFLGPFTSPKHDARLVKGKPAAPLLFVSSRLDPVTPLRNAHRMSQGHPGSAVLEVDTIGHCGSLTPSRCSKQIIQDYLESGQVPKNGTTCAAEFDPWDPSTKDIGLLSVNDFGMPPSV